MRQRGHSTQANIVDHVIFYLHFLFNVSCIIEHYVVIWRRLCDYRYVHYFKFHSDILLYLNFHSAFFLSNCNKFLSFGFLFSK